MRWIHRALCLNKVAAGFMFLFIRTYRRWCIIAMLKAYLLDAGYILREVGISSF
jgi:hypothetical protein